MNMVHPLPEKSNMGGNNISIHTISMTRSPNEREQFEPFGKVSPVITGIEWATSCGMSTDRRRHWVQRSERRVFIVTTTTTTTNTYTTR